MRLDPRGRQGRDAAAAIERGLQGFARGLLDAVKWIGTSWIGAAERIGQLELRALRAIRGPVLATIATTRRWLGTAQREVTPQRALAALILVAAALLVASQFADYRTVRIGAPQYNSVESVAPAPQVDRETAAHAHGYFLLPLALVAVACAAYALRGSWRVAWVASAIGLVGVVVSLAIDLPEGLREGTSGVAFEGARAGVIGGFWVELTSSIVLVIAGLLLARFVRVAKGGARAGPRTSAPGPARSTVAEARP